MKSLKLIPTLRSACATLFASMLLMSFSAQAILIEYDLTDLGGGDYRFEYIITNDSVAGGIEGFSVYFDEGTVVDETAVISGPAGWDPFYIDFGVGLGGAADFLSLGPLLGFGETLGGFFVDVTWIDVAPPGDQFFEAYINPFDFLTFAIVGEGTTSAVQPPPPPPPPPGIPSPGPLVLMALPLLIGALRRKRVIL